MTKQERALRAWVRQRLGINANDAAVGSYRLLGLDPRDVYDLLIEAFVAGYVAGKPAKKPPARKRPPRKKKKRQRSIRWVEPR